MASLTSPQIEILRRLRRGDPLHACSDIPRFLNEVIVLSRIGVVAIDLQGTPTVTHRGVEYLAGLDEDSAFSPWTPTLADLLTPDASDLPQTVPTALHLADMPSGRVPLD